MKKPSKELEANVKGILAFFNLIIGLTVLYGLYYVYSIGLIF